MVEFRLNTLHLSVLLTRPYFKYLVTWIRHGFSGNISFFVPEAIHQDKVSSRRIVKTVGALKIVKNNILLGTRYTRLLSVYPNILVWLKSKSMMQV
jgi:hypothetical protein